MKPGIEDVVALTSRLLQVTWELRDEGTWVQSNRSVWGVGLWLYDNDKFGGPYEGNDGLGYGWSIETDSPRWKQCLPVLRWAWGRLRPWCDRILLSDGG